MFVYRTLCSYLPSICGFCYPELNGKEKKVLHILNEFHLTNKQLTDMYFNLIYFIESGLELNNSTVESDDKKYALPMLETYMNFSQQKPTADEMFALDCGGSGIRFLHQSISNQRTIVLEKIRYENIDPSIDLKSENTTAAVFFSTLAKHIKSKLVNFKSPSSGKAKIDLMSKAKMGLTFSFPCKQVAVDSAFLEKWTKNWYTGRNTNDPVEGRNIVQLFQDAFDKEKVPLNIKIISNDTVATLVQTNVETLHDDKNCYIGAIIGSGVNCCIHIKNSKKYGYVGDIINTEIGQYKYELPFSIFDSPMEHRSHMMEEQNIEKFISGSTIGEIARVCLIQLLNNKSPSLLWKEDTFSAQRLCRIAYANDKKVLMDCLDELYSADSTGFSEKITDMDLDDIQKVSKAILNRSARLAGVCIAACCKVVIDSWNGYDHGKITVGIDGSLYTRNIEYQEQVQQSAHEMLGHSSHMYLFWKKTIDGSGKGAAIMASVL